MTTQDNHNGKTSAPPSEGGGQLTHDWTLLFQHMPKTAGVSISNALLQHYDAEQVFHIRAADSMGPIFSDHHGPRKHFEALPKEQRRQFRLVLGHFTFGLHKCIDNECRYITVLRQPLERILSQYRQFMRQEANVQGHMDVRLSFEEFCERRPVAVDNHQLHFYCPRLYRVSRLKRRLRPIVSLLGQCLRLIVKDAHVLDRYFQRLGHHTALKKAIKNLRTHYMLVGTQDRLDHFMVLLGWKMGWRHVRCGRHNVSRSSFKCEAIDPALLAKLAEVNHYDSRLFAEAGRLLEEAVRDYGSDFDKTLAAYRRDLDRDETFTLPRFAPEPNSCSEHR